MDYEKFGEFLKKHDMSQKAFADFSKTPLSTINDFCTGKTRVPGWIDVLMICYEQNIMAEKKTFDILDILDV